MVHRIHRRYFPCFAKDNSISISNAPLLLNCRMYFNILKYLLLNSLGWAPQNEKKVKCFDWKLSYVIATYKMTKETSPGNYLNKCKEFFL